MQTFNSFPVPGSFPAPRWAAGHPPNPPLMPAPRSYEVEPPSATPIYDALYSEFRRLFRALPGDRSGEEDLHFTGFGHYYQGSSYSDRSGGAGRHRGMLSLPAGRG